MGQQKSGGQQKKKGAKSAGRNKLKMARYLSYEHQGRVGERKLRRILKSSGVVAARAWAAQNGVSGLLQKIEVESVNEATGDQGKFGKLAERALQR